MPEFDLFRPAPASNYADLLREHYERAWGTKWQDANFKPDRPARELPADFRPIIFPPTERRSFWIYATVGMYFCDSHHPIELHMFSPWRDDSILEILYSAASFHLHVQALGAPHTVNLGRSWTPSSLCTHAVIQQPYIDGIALEIFEAAGFHVHCYWLIPITEAEKDFALEHGYEALAELFERKALNYLDPNRASLV